MSSVISFFLYVFFSLFVSSFFLSSFVLFPSFFVTLVVRYIFSYFLS